MDNVLNKKLYDRLKNIFGKVAVYSRGETATYTFDKGSLYEPAQNKIFAKHVTGGEHYAITCPFCKKEGKLWISYLANSYKMEAGTKVHFTRGLIICYRCNFNAEKEKLDSFWRLVGGVEEEIKGGKGEIESEDVVPQKAIKFPYTVSILDPSVPNRVTAYLTQRGMDLQELSEVYNVGYSEDKNVLVKGVPRIIFPISQNGEFIAWQGRCLDVDVERYKVPKYQFPSGVKIKWLLYNSDVARWQPYAILTEGITDVIACGKAGIASFGKTVSIRQVSILRAYWGNKGLIRIPDMDDPEAYEVARKEVASWNAAEIFKQGAHIVLTPRGKDPGDLTRDEISRLILEQTGIEI